MLPGSNVGCRDNAPFQWDAIKSPYEPVWVEGPNDTRTQHAKHEGGLSVGKQNLSATPISAIAYPTGPTLPNSSREFPEQAASLAEFVLVMLRVCSGGIVGHLAVHRGGRQSRLGWDAYGLGQDGVTTQIGPSLLDACTFADLKRPSG